MLSNTLQNPSKRLVHLDLLRLIAIYLVIFNHTGDRGYFLFTNSGDSLLYFPYMMFSVFCKIAVPLFFMISGALLLPKKETLKQLYTKRVFKMLTVLLLVSIPYYLWLQRSNGLNPWSFVSFIYGESASTSLWYLYSYIGLLIVMPFLRSMVANMRYNDYLYLIVGHLIFTGFIPCLELLLWKEQTVIHESFDPAIMTCSPIVYAILGYFLEHVLDEAKYTKRNLAIGLFLGLVAVVLTTLVTYYQTTVINVVGNQYEKYFNCFIAIPALGIYYTIKYISRRIKSNKLINSISMLGASVFGVYLIEKIVRAITDIVYGILSPFVGSFIASLVWCSVVLAMSLVIITVVKRIPYVKDIVNKLI